MLENERIKLRALEPEDLDMLYKWENDTSMWQIGNTVLPYSRYMLKKYIDSSHLSIYEKENIRLIIEYKPDSKAVGAIDLYDYNPHHCRACTGIMIEESYRNMGIASDALGLFTEYAFSFLKIHQLYAYVPSDNEASKALFLRNGFFISGRLADWISMPDGYSEVLIMQHLNR